MSTPTKKDWLNITAIAAEELENMQADLQTCFRSLRHKVEDTENTIDWDWSTYTDTDGREKAVYWDGATGEERAMLDYHAEFVQVWQQTRNEVQQALTLMERAYTRLNELRMKKNGKTTQNITFSWKNLQNFNTFTTFAQNERNKTDNNPR